MVIEEANPPSTIRMVMVPSKHQAEQVGQAAKPQNLLLVPTDKERTMVERNETTIVADVLNKIELERTLTLVTEP